MLVRAVRLEHASVQRDPTALGGFTRGVEQPPGPAQPAAHHRSVAVDLPMHTGERARHPDRADRITLGAVGGVGPLPRRDGSRELEREVTRTRLGLQRDAVLRLHKHSILAPSRRRTQAGTSSPNRQTPRSHGWATAARTAPAAISAAAAARRNVSPWRQVFSSAITAVSPAMSQVFIAPKTSIAVISAQQQPMQ